MPPEEEREESGFQGVEIQDEENLTDDERDALIGYDPFADHQEDDLPSLGEIQARSEGPPAQAAEEEPPVEEPPVEEPPAEAPPVEAPPEDETPREKLLREQNQLLQQRLDVQEQAIRNIQQTRTPPKGSGEEVQEGDNIPPYMFAVTDDYIAALRDEDPNRVRAAIQGIMQGTARAVHGEMRKEYQEHVQTAISSYVNRHARSTQISQTVMEDYYGKYPQHNSPEVQATVVAVAQKVMRAENAQQWTPELRDKIGSEVNRVLGQAIGAPPQGGGERPGGDGAEQNTQSRPAKEQRPGGPRQTRPTSRPAPQPRDTDVGEQVEDLMFG